MVTIGTTAEIKKRVPFKFRVIAPEDAIDREIYKEVIKIGDRAVVYLDNYEMAIAMVGEMLKKGLHAEAAPVTLEDAFVRLAGGAIDEIAEESPKMEVS